jgi:hypothetical protein
MECTNFPIRKKKLEADFNLYFFSEVCRVLQSGEEVVTLRRIVVLAFRKHCPFSQRQKLLGFRKKPAFFFSL